MVTIKDIAKIAGVSYSTVSKALNNSPLVKPSTKKKILALAEQHGYQRNFLAGQLASGKSKLIGFILDHLSNPIFSTIARDLHDELNDRGFRMILAISSKEMDLFRQLRVDGLILWGSGAEGQSDAYESFANLDIPKFVLGVDDDPGLPYIKIDRQQGMFRAVEYLARFGHQRIGLIGDSQEVKLRGYKEALLKNGLQFCDDYIVSANPTWEDGYFAMRNYAFHAASPTAFIGLNNLVTKGALRGLLEAGFKVPDDVSLIGYDNLPDMQFAEVPLTTFGPSLDELVQKAADLITDLIGHESVDYPVVIEPMLHERKSVGFCSDRLEWSPLLRRDLRGNENLEK